MICKLFVKPPPLSDRQRQELELHGVDAMRGLLASSTDGFSGIGRMTPLSLGAITITRGEIQDWLKWHAAQDNCLLKLGTVAAIAAALFSFLALWK